MNFKYTGLVLLSGLLIILQTMQFAYGQNGTAKTELAKLRYLATIVESNPNNLKAHENYIESISVRSIKDVKNSTFTNQYRLWMKRFPKSAIVPFAIGKTFGEYNDSRCKEYLLKAVAIDPKLAVAWEYLSYFASVTDDREAAIAYMKQATEVDPKNANAAFYYAYLHHDGNPAKYDSLMLNVTYRFPHDEVGAKALYFLASHPFNMHEKEIYYDQLFNLYSKQDSPSLNAGMLDYYDYLINTSSDKAFELAMKMVLVVKNNRQDWKQRINTARKFIEARKLMDNGKPDSAIQLLNNISLNDKIMGRKIDGEATLALFKAEVMSITADIRAAYDSLTMYYSKKPTGKIRSALISYAVKMKMDSNRVDTDVWKIRNKAAWKETDFTLENYKDKKNVSLSDYRGKVVLVTFWFPTCGACREEFPYFESVLKKTNSDNVVYFAINVNNREDDYVLPFIKSTNYTFIPLRNNPSKSIGNLPKVYSAPTNFIIDQQGRVIFDNFRITAKNEETLELMIKELLKSESYKKQLTSISRQQELNPK